MFDEQGHHKHLPATDEGGVLTQTLTSIFESRCLKHPDRLAYAFVKDTLELAESATYNELFGQVCRLANDLVRHTAQGDRVLLVYPPGLDFVRAFWACVITGRIAVPVPAPDAARFKNSAPRLLAILSDATATLLMTTEDLREAAQSLQAMSGMPALKIRCASDMLPSSEAPADAALPADCRNVTPDSVAYLQYTSGSTAAPRGVILTHRNIVAQIDSGILALDINDDSRILTWLPHHHDYGLVLSVLWPMGAGVPAYILSSLTFLRRPLRWLEGIARFGVTHTGGPNFSYAACVRAAQQQADWHADLSSLRSVSCGAEPIQLATLDAFASSFQPHGLPRAALMPSYGMAETVLGITTSVMNQGYRARTLHVPSLENHLVLGLSEGAPDSRAIVACGVPFVGMELQIVDPQTLQALPTEAVGEIWVRGTSVGQGYWKQPEASEATFNAYLASGEGPFLRTGDLGFLEGREVFITGRIKDLIIVRGRNLYPHDLEWTAQATDSALRVGYGAAFSIDGVDGEDVVLVQEVERREKGKDLGQITTQIRKAIAETYELPLRAVVLVQAGTLPRTSSGKIRRRNCRQDYLDGQLQVLHLDEAVLIETPDALDDSLPADAALLRTISDATEQLRAIERLLLNRVAYFTRRSTDDVSLDASAIECGLDSLTSFRMLQALETLLDCAIPSSLVLASPDLRALASRLQSLLAGARATSIVPVRAVTSARLGLLPLSTRQQRMWFWQELAPGTALYNIPISLRIEGALDVALLQTCLQELVQRHEILRLRWVNVDGVQRQRVESLDDWQMHHVQLAADDQQAPGQQLETLAAQEAAHAFDLLREPAVRATLVSVTPQLHHLLWIFHHSVSDGWSIKVILEELSQLYTARATGKDLLLPAPALQYLDFAEWETRWLDSGVRERELTYWKAQLRDVPVALELPTDHRRPAHQQFRGGRYDLHFTHGQHQALRQAAKASDTTLYMVLLAAWQLLLHRYSGQSTVVTASVIANRSRVEFDRVVGYFANTLPLRSDFTEGLTVAALLAQVKAASLGAFEHHHVPFEEVVDALDLPRDRSRMPLTQTFFVLQPSEPAEYGMGDVVARRLPLGSSVAKFDLSLELQESDDGLRGWIEYDRDLFEPATIARMVAHLHNLQAGLCADATQPVTHLPMLTPAERHTQLVTWNDTARVCANHVPVQTLIEEQVRRTPDHEAVVAGNERVDYQELNRRANRVAHQLRRLGVGPDVRVGMCMERSVELMVAYLAVAKAGGAFVPMDPDLPQERLAFMLRDTAAPVVITQTHLVERLPATGGTDVCELLVLGPDAPLTTTRNDEDDLNPVCVNSPDDLAYVIYTSGSTGQPRGVMVPHRALSNHALWQLERLSMGPSDRLLQKTTISFDGSISDFYHQLLAGSTIVMAEPGMHRDTGYLVRAMRDHAITMVVVVPSQLQLLLDDPELSTCRHLRLVMCGGEALSAELANRFLERLPHARLGNFYGPSESTIDSTHFEVAERLTGIDTVPIGRPIANGQCYVLDAFREPVPIGVIGELYIGGAGLARGYLNRPELTAELFVAHPFEPEQRVYRTGDLVRWHPDGQLEYIGRRDFQVKVRGVRIELGEVETALREQPAVRQAVAIVREDTPGLKRLVAYVVGNGVDIGSLKQSLRRQLPDAMVPSAVVHLDQLPTLPNGKLNRAALPVPEQQTGQAVFVAPGTPTEQAVWDIWAELLQHTQFGVHENFFELGGHSLLAMQVLSRLRTKLGTDMPLRTLFDAPTVAAFAQKMGQNPGAHATSPMPRAPETNTSALTAAQQGMWFAEKLNAHTAQYNMAQATCLRGPLDLPALERSLQVACERHALLRSQVVEQDGVPMLTNVSDARWALQRLELPPHEVNQREQVLQREMTAFALQTIDLAQAPLARAAVIQLGEQQHVVVLVVHHIAFDGWSLNVLLQELAAEYDTQHRHAPSVLAPLPLQWRDIAFWEHAHAQTEAFAASMAYWRHQLQGLQPLRLPLDIEDATASKADPGLLDAIGLPADLVQGIEAIATQHNASVFMVLLAAFKLVLMRRTGQQDVAVGMPVVGRDNPELESVVGPLLNTLVLRSEFDGVADFAALLRRIRDNTLNALAHQNVPFDRLVAELSPQRELDRSPFFDVLVNSVGRWDGALQLAGLSSEAVPVRSTTPKFPLTLYIRALPGQVQMAVSYRTDRLCAPSVRHLLDQFAEVLQQAVQQPGKPLHAFSLLSPQSRALLADPAAALPPPAFAPVTELVFTQMAQRPGHTAVQSAQWQHRYADLDRATRVVAQRLRDAGVGPGAVVAISGPRSFAVVTSILASLMNGAVFVTLDPSMPLQRKQAMLRECKARVLCLVGDAANDAHAYEGMGIEVTLALRPQLDDLSDTRLGDLPPFKCAAVAADDPAYIFFTSGSTGVPKAVIGRHRGLSHFLAWQRAAFDVTPDDRVSHLVGLSFDPVLRDIFLPLTSGATLCIPQDRDLLDPVAWLAREAISIAHATPSVMQSWLAGTRLNSPLRAMRWLFVAGEPLHDTLVTAWRELCGTQGRIVNLYGPTETTMARCFHVVDDVPRPGIQPVGRTLPDSQALVLDATGQRCGIGESGEVVLRTPLRSLGYLNLPEETRERFRANPWRTNGVDTGAPDDLLYFTGDRGRFRHDGVLEIAGRLDDQMKIRGVRVEPAEVAAVLARHPAVQQCAVVPGSDREGLPMLVAYVVTKPGQYPTVSELRGDLASQLPEAYLPAALVFLDALPMQANGKVDRRRLPAPDTTNTTTVDDHLLVMPRSPIEQALWDIWRSVLRADSFGVFESFFELGGHSLLATQVVARVRDVLGVELPLRALFETPHIAGLAAVVDQYLHEASGHKLKPWPPLTRVARERLLPTSYSQRRMWLVQQVDPETTAYNMPFAARLRGPLNAAALVESLHRLMERHEAFRTTLVAIDGEPMQRIGPVERVPVEQVSLRHLPVDERESAAAELLNRLSTRPYDLAQGPLHRPTLVQLDEQDHVLFWSVHHAIGDGWSAGILMREMAVIYPAILRGREPALTAPLLDFADYASWQRKVFDTETLSEQLSFWKHTLQGLEPLPLPTDRRRQGLNQGRGARTIAHFEPATLVALKRRAAEHNATPYMLLLACFQLMLGRYCGVADIAVGTPIANRTQVSAEHLVGTLVNTVVMRTDLSGDLTFVDLIQRVRETALQAYAHQDIPFEALVEAMGTHRHADAAPLVQVLFNVLTPPQPAQAVDGLAYEFFKFDTGSTQFDLALSIDTDTHHLATLSYSTEVFEPATGERLLRAFMAIVASVVADPQQPLSLIDLVGDEDRQRLADWNGTTVPAAAVQTVHELVARQAVQTPASIAISQTGVGNLLYAELESRANRLAHALRARGIGRGALVGLCVDRSIDMVVSQLAVLKAGAAYVPLDPAYPADRLAYMAQDAQLALLVTESSLVQAVDWPREQSLLLDADIAFIAAQSDAPLTTVDDRNARPEDPAYVIYTSGSTGKPKGVVVHHRAVVNFLTSMAREPGLSASDTLVAVTTLSFDIAVLELLLPLSVGARVVLASREQTMDGQALYDLIEDTRATVMQATPSTWRVLIDAGWQGSSRFKALIGGEGLPLDLANQLLARTGELWNMYGPTETTVWSSCWKVVNPENGISIGRPIANTQLHVLDERQQLCPIGVPGELYIGGDGVTLGYLHRPELTAERFIPDPFNPGARLYRTGDRGRWRHDGLLEHQGRLDFQVKVRGHRIELGEIESQLATHAEVARTVVIVREDTPGDQRLVAYVVPHGEMPEAHNLREHLRASLPDYMVPQYFVSMPVIPLLPNGKIDRNSLPKPQANAIQATQSVAAQPPQTPVEIAIAAVWKRLLEVQEVDLRDNFFDLGGHSLLAMRAITELNKLPGVNLTVRQLIFENLGQIARAVPQNGAPGADNARQPQKDGKVVR